MSQSDDLQNSSSTSFASNSEEERKDEILEKVHFHEDINYGGLENISDDEVKPEDEPDQNQQHKLQQVNEAFMRATKYNTNAELPEQTQQLVQEQLNQVLNSIDQNTSQKQQTQTTPRNQRNMILQMKFQNKQKAEDAANLALLQKQRQLQQLDREIEQKKLLNNQLGAEAQIRNEFFSIEEQEPETTQIKLLVKEAIKQQNYDVKFELFEQQQEKDSKSVLQLNLNLKDSIQDTNIVTFETTPKTIASIYQNKLNMFLMNVEQFGDAGALMWGKVIVYDDKSELSGGYDPGKSQLQNCCVVVNGLERQLYCLVDESQEKLCKLEGADINEIFKANGQVVQDEEGNNVKFIDQIDEKVLNMPFCTQSINKLKEAISQLIKCQAGQIKIQPVFRVYCFNDVNVPREPRVWFKIRYSAKYVAIEQEMLTSQLNTVKFCLGHSLKPIDLFLAENQIRGCSWIQVKNFNTADYQKRYADILQFSQSKNTEKQYFNYKMFNQCIKGPRVFHEFQLTLNNQQNEQQIETIPLDKQYAPPPASTLTISIRKLNDRESGMEVPVIIQMTYIMKNSLNTSLSKYEQSSKTYIIGRTIENQNPYTNSTVNVPLQQLSLNNETGFANVQIFTVNREIEMIQKMQELIALLNPDFIISHGLYGSIQQILKRCAQYPNSIIQESVFITSRISNKINLQNIQSIDPIRLTNLLYQGRMCVDLEKIINEFSPDTKQTSIEYCLNVLFDQELNNTPSNFLVDYYKDLQKFKNQLLPELIREQFATLKVEQGLSYLQLTSKIAQLTYFQLQNVLQLGRAKRVENVLLTNFLQLPFIIPDYQQSKESHEKFTGGYVIEPSPGMYDNVIIVLDFNSLYPSIIREYDICFTTVPPNVNEENYLEKVDEYSKFIFSRQLPRIIGELVSQRLNIKKKIKSQQIKQKAEPSNLLISQQLQELDIQQLALKLCANSMYGSLGYERGRFFCPRVAAAIPNRGRAELMNAVSVAKIQGYDVIYGDTDSIMINSKLQFENFNKEEHSKQTQKGRKDIDAIMKGCQEIALKLTNKISEGKKFLEMGLDYVFVKQLLLAKKKYAALKINAMQSTVHLEVRGLDMVRRDWCEISRAMCKQVVELLMWNNLSEGIEQVMNFVRFMGQQLETKSDNIKFKHFMMTKSISKPLKQYQGQSEDLAHVYVAKNLEKTGKLIRPGYVVEYLVLSNEIAQKQQEIVGDIPLCRRGVPFEMHQTQFKGVHPNDVLDMHWYITNQILPPLERLCTPIQDLSRQSLAMAFNITIKETVFDNEVNNQKKALSTDLREQFDSCICFCYKCKCSQIKFWPEYDCNSKLVPICNLDECSRAHRGKSADNNDQSLLSIPDFLELNCQHQVNISIAINQLIKQITYFEQLYYSNIRTCSNTNCHFYISRDDREKMLHGETDLLFKYSARQLVQLQDKCPSETCAFGELKQIYTRDMFLRQLLFFQDIFDTKSPFYQNTSDLMKKDDILSALKSTVNWYIEKSKLAEVNVRNMIKKYFE